MKLMHEGKSFPNILEVAKITNWHTFSTEGSPLDVRSENDAFGPQNSLIAEMERQLKVGWPRAGRQPYTPGWSSLRPTKLEAQNARIQLKLLERTVRARPKRKETPPSFHGAPTHPQSER